MLIIGISVLLLHTSLTAKAGNRDTLISNEIKQQLTNQNHLQYPGEVARIYQRADNGLIWLSGNPVKSHITDAMMLLDCVIQYGLNQTDYHHQDLSYDQLAVLNKPSSEIKQRVRFDLLLTDAMITLMNNLHYGKFNPQLSSAKIDDNHFTGFRADAALWDALQSKYFVKIIEHAQPQFNGYTSLQSRMRLLVGQYSGDSYEECKAEVMKIAVNMERLRWADLKDHMIQVNLPSNTLKWALPDSTYQFKVIAGNSKTPAMQSRITYFTISPEPTEVTEAMRIRLIKDPAYRENNHWALQKRHPNQQIVFHFASTDSVCLYGNPRKGMFALQGAAPNLSAIVLEDPARFAALLLRFGRSKKTITRSDARKYLYTNGRYVLTKPITVAITYQTCEIRQGVLFSYKDIYNLDKSLEMALYPINNMLVKR